MEKPKRGLVLREVGHFYALAFALSWAGWAPALLRQWRVPGFGSVLWLGLTAFGAAGPAIAAWIVDNRTFRSFRIAVGWRWLLAAALIPAGLLLMTNALSWALLGLHPQSTVRGLQILSDYGHGSRSKCVGRSWLESLCIATARRRYAAVDGGVDCRYPLGWLACATLPLELEWNDADSVWMVGAANNRNVGHHGLALQLHRRQSLGSHRISYRVERVGSLDRSLVALGRGERSVDGGGFFAFAHKRTARPVTLFPRVRWGRGSDWYR